MKLAEKVLSLFDENKLENSPMAELERKLKSDKKNFKNIEIVDNKGVKNELHVDTTNDIHFNIQSHKGWFSIAGKNQYLDKYVSKDKSLNTQNFDRILNADRVIDIMKKIIAISNSSDFDEATMTTGEDLYSKIKKIVDDKSMGKIDGTKIDLTSANMMLSVLDKLKPETRTKALSQGVKKLLNITMKVA
jgi:hypothetical protein